MNTQNFAFWTVKKKKKKKKSSTVTFKKDFHFKRFEHFRRLYNFRKRKIFSAVWLSRKSFFRKSIPVFGSSKYFTEIVLRKINSSVWFVQTFYGKYLTEIVLRKIISGVWFVDHFTENMKCVTNSSTCII